MADCEKQEAHNLVSYLLSHYVYLINLDDLSSCLSRAPIPHTLLSVVEANRTRIAADVREFEVIYVIRRRSPVPGPRV